MISQYTRELIRKEAEARALEKSSVKVEVKKPEDSVEVIEETKMVNENSTVEESKKKTDAEKLKKKKE